MKYLAIMLLMPSVAFAQLVSDYKSPFETATMTATIAAQATNASNPSNDVSPNLLTPINVKPTYPTTITPLGDERNGYQVNGPGMNTITCIPQGGGNMSCY